MNPIDKPLVWLGGDVESPPLSKEARTEAGYLLRYLQAGILLTMPHSRPMPAIGSRCRELRMYDDDSTWRIIDRTDDDAIVILDVIQKKTGKTPPAMIENCRRRARKHDQDAREEGRDGKPEKESTRIQGLDGRFLD